MRHPTISLFLFGQTWLSLSAKNACLYSGPSMCRQDTAASAICKGSVGVVSLMVRVLSGMAHQPKQNLISQCPKILLGGGGKVVQDFWIIDKAQHDILGA